MENVCAREGNRNYTSRCVCGAYVQCLCVVLGVRVSDCVCVVGVYVWQEGGLFLQLLHPLTVM